MIIKPKSKIKLIIVQMILCLISYSVLYFLCTSDNEYETYEIIIVNSIVFFFVLFNIDTVTSIEINEEKIIIKSFFF